MRGDTTPTSKEHHPPMRTILRVAGLALIVAGTVLGFSGGAGGQTLPPLVTDYGNYPDTPQAQLTEGCDFSGLSLVTFTVNGGSPVGNLGVLPAFAAGDVVTMSWQAVSEECVGSTVSLVVKDAPQPFFDSTVDQPTAAYNTGTLTDQDGGGSLSLTMPDLSGSEHGCAYQLDAIVGVPLGVVGPSGSFYNASLRGDERRTTLISFQNGAYEECEPATTTTTGSTTTTTGSTTTTTGSTTTTGQTTTTTGSTTTVPQTTTTEPPTTTTQPTTTTVASCASLGLAVAADGSCFKPVSATTPAAARPVLAATGATKATPWTALVGILAVGLGVLLLVAGGRRFNRTP